MYKVDNFTELSAMLSGLNCIKEKEEKLYGKYKCTGKFKTKSISTEFTARNIDVVSQINENSSCSQTDSTCDEDYSEASSLYKMEIKSYSPHIFMRFNKKRPNIDYSHFIYSPNLFGKSGSRIFFSSDGQYVIKTIRRKEYLTFKAILFNYFKYYHDDTFLCNYFGLYKISSKNTMFFTIMNNFLPINESLKIYDLKGSFFLRKSRNRCALKDQDWRDNCEYLYIDQSQSIKNKLNKDTRFLRKNDIMDYSLIIGILEKKDIPSKNKQSTTNSKTQYKNDSNTNYENIKCKNRASTIRQIPGLSIDVPTTDLDITPKGMPPTKDLRGIDFFYVDLLKRQKKRIESLDFQTPHFVSKDDETLYFIGIIDILTKWDLKKSIEHFIYRILCINNFSSVNPKAYSKRFMKMVNERLFNEK